MHLLDFRTVLTGYLFTSVICMLVMVSLWRQNRGHVAGVGYWLADFVMQATGLLLLTLRDAIPDMLSVLLGSGLIVAGTPVLYLGLRAYLGKPARLGYNAALLALFMVVHTWFLLVEPSQLARNVNMAVFLFVFCMQCAALLLRQADPAVRRAAAPVGWVMAGFCVVSLVRIGTEWLLPPAHHMFAQSAYISLVLMAYQMLYIGLTFALFLMVNRQLAQALGNEVKALAASSEAL
ncbi:MAG: hypothetical protein K2W33_17490, partial [Burkholderiales bacterium]|nr:hypothetical protein [Burkholderiales bacterium]